WVNRPGSSAESESGPCRSSPRTSSSAPVVPFRCSRKPCLLTRATRVSSRATHFGHRRTISTPAAAKASSASGFGSRPSCRASGTGYELLHAGKRYAPKAVIGQVCRRLLGRVLRPDEFSGGEAPVQANHVLRQLGFTVVKKAPGADDEGQAGKDWT